MHTRNIRLFYAIAFLQGMVFYAPIATLYREARGIDIFQLTLIESISLAVCLLLEIPWGFAADRIGYRKTLLICNILYFASKIVFWQAHGFSAFLAERLILSVVISGLSGCDSAFLYLSCGEDEKQSQKVFGIYSAMGTAGILLAAAITPLPLRWGDSYTALFTVFPYAAAAVLTAFLTDVWKPVENPIPFRLRIRALAEGLKNDIRFLPFLVSAALFSQCHQTIVTFLNQLQYRRSGIPTAAMGALYILITVAGLSAARAHRLTQRLGNSKSVLLLLLTGGISCVLLYFTANPVLSVAGLLLLHVAFSLFTPVQMELENRRVRGSSRATILSVYSIIGESVAAVTNLAFGKSADSGVANAMLLGAAFCAAALILFILWRFWEQRPSAQAGE